MYWTFALQSYMDATIFFILPAYILGALIRSFKIEVSEENGTFLKQFFYIWFSLLWRVPLWILTVWSELDETLPDLGGFTALATFILIGYVFVSPFFGPSEDEILQNIQTRQELILNLGNLNEDDIEQKALILVKIINLETLKDNSTYESEYRELNNVWLNDNPNSDYLSIGEKVLVNELKLIPSTDFDANISAYKIISKINPENEYYSLKESYYKFLKYDVPEAKEIDRKIDECVDEKSDRLYQNCKSSCQSDPITTYCGIAYQAKGKSIIGSGCTGRIKGKGGYLEQVEFCSEKACDDEIRSNFDITLENFRECRNSVPESEDVSDILRVKSFEDFRSYYDSKYNN